MTSRRGALRAEGFTLVEVLIALVVLFSAIVSFSASYKLYVSVRIKYDLYQNVYGTVLSLKNMIESRVLTDSIKDSGEINGFQFEYEVKKIESARNYVPDDMGVGANRGPFQISVYYTSLRLRKGNWNNAFFFYTTQYQIEGGGKSLKEF